MKKPTKYRQMLTVLLAVVVTLSVTAPKLWAIAPPEAKIIIELNATDEDVGIQIFFDGPGWMRLEVFDPDGWRIFDVSASGSVQMQGVTELFFESEEPSLEELPLDDFLTRFPEGQYTFVGVTLNGQILKGKATLTHNIPDGPVISSPQEGGVVDPNNTVIEWMQVADPPGSKIVGYQVIVERAKPTLAVFSVDVSPTTTSVTVPPAFMEPHTNYKCEVLAIEASGNQTISEREFKTE
ncbi:MAG: fibronectin type III domain-containing protein [Acidobacteria bacterium]|nr:fibronectin type III domain-containing protein [Acidobacteriota bacterium]